MREPQITISDTRLCNRRTRTLRITGTERSAIYSNTSRKRKHAGSPGACSGTEPGKRFLAGRLNAFYQSYDWYEYQDTIEAGEAQEDVLRQLQEQLEDPQSVQEIYSYLIRVREGMDTEDENYSEVSELIAGIAALPAMNPPYDLQVDTIVTIGTKDYSIDFISDEMVVLRDQMYPLFTEEMQREVVWTAGYGKILLTII